MANDAIENIDPKTLWKHFAQLSAIPRSSGNEAAARNYVLDLAKRLGLEAVQDKVGNVIVRKPAHAGRESAPPTAMQSHLDMVCEKNEGTPHNFDTDPIQFVRDGDWIRANGTTLGADNGIGVAACLAVMESTAVPHPPMEFIFTIDEENGLTGAAEFGSGVLRSKVFLNLDSEEEGTLCIGCAGGINTVGRRAIRRRAATADRALRIKVSGLKGGHSGIDIHLGRGNALRILGRVLQALANETQVEVADVQGGSKRNAIPREAAAIVVARDGDVSKVEATVARLDAEVRSELGAFDPDVRLSIDPAARPDQVIEPADLAIITTMLTSLPHGVLAMSPDVSGLVQTSTNLATVATTDSEVEIATSQRSSVESSKNAAAAMVVNIFRLAGFEIAHSGSYPGWKPEPKSDIVRTVQSVYQGLYGKVPELIAMHAGLECGVIGEKNPGMQMISFGPTIVDVHSPAERVNIPSVVAFWRLLEAVLAKL